MGTGKFLNAEMVRERSSLYVTDALRGIAGIFVTMNEGFGLTGQDIRMRGPDGIQCKPVMFLDGLYIHEAATQIDNFIPRDQVAAVEVYTRPSQVPAEFMSGGPPAGSTMVGGCGVIAFWTKVGTSNVPILPPKSERR